MTAFLPITYLCPITQRDRSACLYVGYRQACARFFAKRSEKTGIKVHPPCQLAAAEKSVDTVPETKIPPQKENVMADNKDGSKKCACCGRQKRLISHLGKGVCSSCMAIRIAARNKTEMMIETLREFGALPRDSKSVEGVDDLMAELEILRTENASLVQEVARLRQSDKGNGIGEFLSKFLMIDNNGLRIDIRPIREGVARS